MLGPEKKVEAEILAWAYRNKIYLNVYDSKAVYSLKKKAYSKNRGLVEGHPDLLGSNDKGLCIAIELKAPTKEHTLTAIQLRFLVRMIEWNAFACVATCSQELDHLYNSFLNLTCTKERQALLKSALPKKITNSGRVINTFIT